jgi:hypothetical protein
MKPRSKRVPPLASEAAERRFWESHDSTPFVDWSRSEREANSRDVPYQSLIKIWLEEKLSA